MIDDDAEARETGAGDAKGGSISWACCTGAESITAEAGQTKAEMPRLVQKLFNG